MIVVVTLFLASAATILAFLVWRFIKKDYQKNDQPMGRKYCNLKPERVERHKYQRITDLQSPDPQPLLTSSPPKNSYVNQHIFNKSPDIPTSTMAGYNMGPHPPLSRTENSAEQCHGEQCRLNRLARIINNMKLHDNSNGRENFGFPKNRRTPVNLKRAISSIKKGDRAKETGNVWLQEQNLMSSNSNSFIIGTPPFWSRNNSSKRHKHKHGQKHVHGYTRSSKGNKKKSMDKRKHRSAKGHDLSHLIPQRSERFNWYKLGHVSHLVGSSKIKLKDKLKRKWKKMRLKECKMDDICHVSPYEPDESSDPQYRAKLRGMEELTRKKKTSKSKTKMKRNKRKRKHDSDYVEVLSADNDAVKRFNRRKSQNYLKKTSKHRN